MNPDFIHAIYGGLLIGLSSIIILMTLGKITGISGIFWRSLSNLKHFKNSAQSWQVFFLVGLLIGPLFIHYVFHFPIPKPSDSGIGIALIGALLVGFGSNYGSGCTSGHGICGIGRLSKRSIVATMTFMLSGIIAVYLSQFILWRVFLEKYNFIIRRPTF
jgi:uncharacterized membrane protein YedE/YeeE